MHFAQFHINVKELFTIIAAIHCWGHDGKDRQVVIETDNMAMVQVWQTGSCKCKSIMSLIRWIFSFLVEGNLNIVLEPTPGVQNIELDMCSSLQVDKFLASKEGFVNAQTVPPENVWQWSNAND